MATQSLADGSYRTMIRAVTSALTAGLLDVQRYVEYQRVKTYWAIGHEIRRAAQASKGAMALNDALCEKISAEVKQALGLELSPNTILRSVQFVREYPTFPTDTPLSFTHYLALMRIDDPKKRRALEKKAITTGMTSPALKEIVLKMNAPAPALLSANTRRLPVERGEPYIYHLRPYSGLAGAQYLGVDCGFKIHVPVGGAINVRAPKIASAEVRYVRSVKKDGRYEIRLAVRKRACVYTYAARVLKVLDGDTLDALVDAGFGIQLHERFRLKAIDAPEIKTRAGQDAKAFLHGYLAKCPAIIVRTIKTEMYGRWLGDVFALKGANDPQAIAAKGEYVNQLMLDNGFAAEYK